MSSPILKEWNQVRDRALKSSRTEMADFVSPENLCNYCQFGSRCPVNQSICACLPGYEHDAVFFHDPTCSIPVGVILAWFVVASLCTLALLLVLMSKDFNLDGLWSFVSSFFDCVRTGSTVSSSSSPIPVQPRHRQSSFRMPPPPQLRRSRTESSQKHKDELKWRAVMVVILSYSYVVAVYVENRAGIYANIAFCLLYFALAAYMSSAVLYVVKPLFRALGKQRFRRMWRFTRMLFGFFFIMFLTITGVMIARNTPDDMTNPAKTADRIGYNRVTAFLVMWVVLFAISFLMLLTYHISKLISKLKSTASFRDGDVVMVANYGRLIQVRRQTWLIALCIIVSLPWIVVHLVIGVAPWFWACIMLSFIAGPSSLTWFQYTLTKPTAASAYFEMNAVPDRAAAMEMSSVHPQDQDPTQRVMRFPSGTQGDATPRRNRQHSDTEEYEDEEGGSSVMLSPVREEDEEDECEMDIDEEEPLDDCHCTGAEASSNPNRNSLQLT